MLYDYVRCPHRVCTDLSGDPSKRDKVSVFVQLLWDTGSIQMSLTGEFIGMCVISVNVIGLSMSAAASRSRCEPCGLEILMGIGPWYTHDQTHL
jgi:hypothetical protein